MSNLRIRYAVVGLGHIAQTAVLPAFAHCKHSRLTALVSSDEQKLALLGRKYHVKERYSYAQFEECLRSGEVDAVYLAVPNHLHKEFVLRAASCGVHVLCEKPMAVSTVDAREMLRACERAEVKLMIAYRLHFEKANLLAIDLIHRKRRLGEPRLFQSIHAQPADYPNIRTLPIEQGGGPTYDVGVYDINAARYIFQDEPQSVFAEAVNSGKERFEGIEEAMAVTLRFPGERLASILYSFGAAKVDTFRVVGTEGDLRLDPAYTYHGDKTLELTVRGRESHRRFSARDQFAPEIDYFSRCILTNQAPEPSGREGLADLRIIEAIYESATTGRPVLLEPFGRAARPDLRQESSRPPVKPPRVIHAKAPSRKSAA